MFVLFKVYDDKDNPQEVLYKAREEDIHRALAASIGTGYGVAGIVNVFNDEGIHVENVVWVYEHNSEGDVTENRIARYDAYPDCIKEDPLTAEEMSNVKDFSEFGKEFPHHSHKTIDYNGIKKLQEEKDEMRKQEEQMQARIDKVHRDALSAALLKTGIEEATNEYVRFCFESKEFSPIDGASFWSYAFDQVIEAVAKRLFKGKKRLQEAFRLGYCHYRTAYGEDLTLSDLESKCDENQIQAWELGRKLNKDFHLHERAKTETQAWFEDRFPGKKRENGKLYQAWYKHYNKTRKTLEQKFVFKKETYNGFVYFENHLPGLPDTQLPEVVCLTT
jgi:hypothetical protein